MGLQNNSAYGALNAADFHDLLMHDLAKFLNVRSAHKGNDIILTCDLVDFLDVVEFLKGFDDLIYLVFIGEDVDGC